MTQLKDEVTQADIDAARSIEWVNTAIDNHEAIAETFAHHRIAHVRPADDVVEVLREARVVLTAVSPERVCRVLGMNRVLGAVDADHTTSIIEDAPF